MAAVGTQFPLTSSDRAHSHQVASGLRLSSRTHAMTGNETLTLDSYVALANYCRCADNYWRLRCADNWNATLGGLDMPQYCLCSLFVLRCRHLIFPRVTRRFTVDVGPNQIPRHTGHRFKRQNMLGGWPWVVPLSDFLRADPKAAGNSF